MRNANNNENVNLVLGSPIQDYQATGNSILNNQRTNRRSTTCKSYTESCCLPFTASFAGFFVGLYLQWPTKYIAVATVGFGVGAKLINMLIGCCLPEEKKVTPPPDTPATTVITDKMSYQKFPDDETLSV